MTVFSKECENSPGNEMYQWVKDLFPICRSITGEGVRKTLQYLQNINPELNLHEVNTGDNVFDWEIPKEWNIKDAWVKNEDGTKVIDFRENNLHVVGYSIPIKKTMNLDELQQNIYSLPDQRDAIPYVTSYYKERWGFCLDEERREKLEEGLYEVFIDSTLEDGCLNYADLILQGESDKEILFSTYVCHPSMANNELSGPAVASALIRFLKSIKNRHYTYRFVFVPETIGAIAYLSKNYERMRERTVAGYVLTCIGDERSYSMLRSRFGNTLADKVLQFALESHTGGEFKDYSFLERGSDERQYCSPGIDLPVCNIMRTKYGQYSEYHTSKDDLNLVTPNGLQGGYEVAKKVVEILEENFEYELTTLGEPQLGKRGLYPTLSTKNMEIEHKIINDLVAYADGKSDLMKLSSLLGVDFFMLSKVAKRLEVAGVLRKKL